MANSSSTASSSAVPSMPERAGGLVISLSLAGVLRIVFAFAAFLQVMSGAEQSPLVLYGLPVVYLAEMACFYGLYKWQKWGGYGLVLALVADVILSLMAGLPPVGIWFPVLVVALILLFMVRPQWAYYKG